MIELTDDSFYSLCESAAGLLMVDCWSPGCGPCRQLVPILKNLAEKNLDVTFAKLDVSDNPQSASMLAISGVPTIYFFKNGLAVKRILGLHTEQQLQKLIDELK
jgi:thioredoxin 1